MLKTVELLCEFCGAIFRVEPSRAKHGRGKHCSKSCQYAARRAAPKTLARYVCVGCSATFERPRAKAGARFCSRECRDQNRVGPLHPQHKGAPRRYYRGPNWGAQKRKARARDSRTCQTCGAPGPDVHHIAPFRWFDSYVDANDLGNLVTLCKPCHRKADAFVQAIE